MYDKTSRPPPVGSLREALFLTVWLRRQETEALKMRLLAVGLADAAQGEVSTSAIYKDFLNTLFPFLKKHQSETDLKMVERMQKEVAKGPIAFSAIDVNPLKERARVMRVENVFAEKLKKARTLR